MAVLAATETRVLHVDDDPGLVDLSAELLEREREGLVVETASGAAEGLEVLSEERVDCVVSDYEMPGRDGIEFLEAVREEHPDLPFILLTGRGNEQVAGEAVSAGVTDYLQKGGGVDQYALLANRVVNAVERARAERARKRQLEAIEAAQEGIAILDADGRFTYVSEAYADLYGYEPDALVDEHWELLYPDDEATADRETVLSTARAEGRWHGRIAGLRADGTTVRGDHVVSATAAGDIVCAVRDVSDSEQSDPDTTRYRQLIEAMGDPVYVLDADGYYTYINEAFVETFGYERGELLGKHASLLVSQPDFERGTDRIRGLLGDDDRQTATWELETTTAGGEAVVVENHLSLLPSPDGEFRGSIGVVRDITDRSARERDLRRYEQLVNGMQAAACLYDEDGRFVVVNDRLAALYGTTREALQGRQSALVSTVREQREGDPYEALLAGERESVSGQVTGEFPGQGADTLSYRLVPLSVDGEVDGVVGVAREVPEQKRREQRLERQKERLEELLRVVSHDLRNPLNVARGRLALVREEGNGTHVDTISHALDRMEQLLDDLTTLAREGDAVEETSPVDLQQAVEGCWRNVDTADATLVTETDRVLRADYGRLQRLLENLLGNAVEHGTTGSQGQSGAAEHGDGGLTVTVGSLPDGFYVADDGAGIPPEEREEVFQGGYSTAEEGSGLGLAIVREAAEAHGWTVTVTESADGGARFEVAGVDTV